MSAVPERCPSPAAPSRPCPCCALRSLPRPPAVPPLGPDPAGTVHCAGCGVVFVDPIPAPALTPETYGPRYYDPWQRKEERARRALWRRRLRLIRDRTPGGSLLDIGCGDGHFLQVARAAGLVIEGIEFSPEGARRAARRLGRPVACGDLARDPLLPGPFDVITLWHVLEHLPDAAAMLRAARRRLRAGGLLVVAVPNLDNRPMQIAYRLARRRPLPLHAAGAREPHLTHFSPHTLAGLLRRQGFEAIVIRPDRCALSLPKRALDALAAVLSRVGGRLLTDAIVAFARVPR